MQTSWAARRLGRFGFGSSRALLHGTLALLAFASTACDGDDLPGEIPYVQPSYGDPCRFAKCGEHGECVEGSNGGPVCACDDGWAGARCDVCAAGFHSDFEGRCIEDRTCSDETENPCGSHGVCTDDMGVIACECDPGYEGPRCALCERGYAPNEDGDCLLVVGGGNDDPVVPPTMPPPGNGDPELCTADACNGHGACSESNGQFMCACATGYVGSRCGSCAPTHRRDANDQCVPAEKCVAGACGEHGECSDAGGVIACECSAGYGGEACDSCAPGFHDDQGACVLDQQCLPTSCAGHGACTASAGATSCACQPAYAGERCDRCAAGHHRDSLDACAPDESCAAGACGVHGDCVSQGGIAICDCDDGYTGARCAACAPGFHDDGSGSCVLDTRCLPNSCPEQAACSDTGGKVTCTCETGYAGTECDACAAGYYRNHGTGRCNVFDCRDNPIDAGLVTFDGTAGFPAHLNNCVSGVRPGTNDLQLRSIGGDGEVWACSAHDTYDLETQHVFIEAGARGTAQLDFAGPIGTLSFDYGARSALDLEILADGVVIGSLKAVRLSHNALSLMFESPVTRVELRAANASTNRVALDNIAFAPPTCN